MQLKTTSDGGRGVEPWRANSQMGCSEVCKCFSRAAADYMGIQQTMSRSHLAAVTFMGNTAASKSALVDVIPLISLLSWEALLGLGMQYLPSDCGHENSLEEVLCIECCLHIPLSDFNSLKQSAYGGEQRISNARNCTLNGKQI
ncbi:unnamed protein product [Lepidochelys kempii]